MGRTRKTKHTSLGKSLVKKNKSGWDASNKEDHHHGYSTTAAEDQTKTLKSVTEESSYEEFIATATLASKDFTAEKLNIKFVSLSTAATTDDDGGGNYLTDAEKKLVSVPRRPKWTVEMSAEELNEIENEAFLNWRRHMAQLQDKDGITPFERNIEVWKQLWRVVERADIVVQIVDARNPLLYRCEDLETYVKELGKIPVLLINKSDFLTERQRILWSQYFSSIDLPHAFYSAEAMKALKEIKDDNEDEDELEEEEGEGSDFSESEDESDSDESEEESEEEETAEDEEKPKVQASTGAAAAAPPASPVRVDILNREQLIQYLKSFKKKCKKDGGGDGGEFNVGLVGYPNVGKSSTINSIMALKKTSVSSTPGKTKHFQTLFLEDDLILCDCPGLVMPAFGGSKGEMVLGGILPIDQLTEYKQSMAILAKRIPRPVLQFKYGITLPEEFNHDDLLNAYAAIRGFMTVRGLPDESRAARQMLKDYVNGKLLYNHSPPNVAQEEFQPKALSENLIRNFISNDTKKVIHFSSAEEQSKLLKVPTVPKSSKERSLDSQFFNPAGNAGAAHVKGRLHVASGLSSTSSSSSSNGIADKPWRKHNNRNKKEKLRRVYHDLDVHN